MRPWSVVVAHPEAMMAEGLAAGLRKYRPIVPIAAVSTVAELERYVDRADAVALAEGFTDAPRVVRGLAAKGIRVIVVGDPREDQEGVQVPTRASIGTLAAALLPGNMQPHTNGGAGPRSLTPRETEVLDLVSRGMAAKQIARALGISSKTVELHKSHIFAKLGVPNQTAAVSVILSETLENGNGWTHSST